MSELSTLPVATDSDEESELTRRARAVAAAAPPLSPEQRSRIATMIGAGDRA